MYCIGSDPKTLFCCTITSPTEAQSSLISNVNTFFVKVPTPVVDCIPFNLTYRKER